MSRQAAGGLLVESCGVWDRALEGRLADTGVVVVVVVWRGRAAATLGRGRAGGHGGM
eukprot:COSAG02_NODE_3883_length_6088_cov_2.425781_3_plen_57_part_00